MRRIGRAKPVRLNPASLIAMAGSPLPALSAPIALQSTTSISDRLLIHDRAPNIPHYQNTLAHKTTTGHRPEVQ